MRISTLVALTVLGAQLSTAAALTPELERALRENGTIYLATRRADGTRSSAAPVWFWWDGKNIYSTTSPGSHKAKRLRRGSPVYFSFSPDGPFIETTAEIITDLDVVARMGDEYNKKYWIAWLGFFRPRPDRISDGKTIAFKLTLPESGS